MFGGFRGLAMIPKGWKRLPYELISAMLGWGGILYIERNDIFSLYNVLSPLVPFPYAHVLNMCCDTYPIQAWHSGVKSGTVGYYTERVQLRQPLSINCQ